MRKTSFFKAFEAFLAVFLAFAAPAHAISIIRDAEIERLLNEYTDPIVIAAGLDPEAVDIYMVNDPTLNAFVAGGQNIFFHTGLIVAAETPSELIGVAAHETGPMAGGHLSQFSDGASAASMPMLVGLGLGIIAIAAGSPDAGLAMIAGGQHIGQMEFLSYTRMQESAADQAAVTYLERAEMSPAGLTSFFEKFRTQEMASGANKYPYWRTHPLSSDRIAALRHRVENAPYLHVKDSRESLYRFNMAKAKLYGFLGRPESALRRFPESNQSNPAHYARSIAYFRAGSLDKALGEIDSLIETEPTNPYFQELKGQILFESGQVVDSIPFHRRSVELAPNEPLLQLNLGQALVALPKAEKDMDINRDAQSHLKKAVSLEKELPFAYHQLAITYARAGDAGMADLATAERYYFMGDMGGAVNFASRAKGKLKKGTPHWNRALDILNAAQVAKENKRGR